MLDRLTSLEVFARVAGAGSLSAAARALGMSQTMVTKHIAALESRLGARLFHRTTRRLSITEAGRNYLESAMRILAEIEAADAAVTADRVEPKGLLRLNAPVSFGTRQIAPLLAEFAARCPRVTVELGLNDRLVDLAEEGWDPRDPCRQSLQFEPDRAADRAVPDGAVRGTVLSGIARHAPQGG